MEPSAPPPAPPGVKMKKPNKDQMPFYSLPPDKQNPTAIINEARSSLRSVKTKRPFTPRDSKRTLFGDTSRNAVARPPSAFSLGSRHFDGGSDSRPTSGTSRPPSAARLSPIDHKEAGPQQAPPSSVPSGRRGLRQRLYQTKSVESVLETPVTTGSHGNGLVPVPPNQAKSSSKRQYLPEQQIAAGVQADGGTITPRRTHSGPKERPCYVSDDFTTIPNRVSSAECVSKSKRERHEGPATSSSSELSSASDHTVSCSSGDQHSAPFQDQSDEMTYWTNVIVPIVKKMDKDDKTTEELCDLSDELYCSLEAKQLLGRRAKQRSSILKSIFKLLDIDSPRLLLHLAQIILALKVTGNNLTNVMKLIFRVCRSDENDSFFLENNILENLLLAVDSVADGKLSADVFVYAYGSLKFLTGNTEILKRLVELGCVETTARLLTVINNNETNKTDEQIANLLVQITATVRHLADGVSSPDRFLHCGIVQQLFILMRSHSNDPDLMHNISRVFSKLTLNTELCNLVSNIDNCFETFLQLLTKQLKKQEIVVRVCFILGNLTSKHDAARLTLFSVPNFTHTVLSVLRTYLELDYKSTQEKQKPVAGSESDNNNNNNNEPSKTEDVLIKLIRVIANICIHHDIGGLLATDETLADYLIQLLNYKTVDDSEELVLNTVATINNLSYYNIHNSAILLKQLDISELLVSLLLNTNMDAVIEAIRVFGNLSRDKTVRNFIRNKKIDRMMVTLLDSQNHELVFTACGVLINLMADTDCRTTLLNEGGIKKLCDVLRDFGRKDWQLSGMVCQTLWNYSESITSSTFCFGQEHSRELIDLLTFYTDEEAILTDMTDDLDEACVSYLVELWREEFLPVAIQLLQRIEQHQSNLEPL